MVFCCCALVISISCLAYFIINALALRRCLPFRGNRREAAIRCNNSWRTDGIRLRGVENVPMEWQRYFRLRTESEIWCDDSRFWEAKLLIFRKKWVKMPVPNPKTEILCYKKNLMASHRNYPPATPTILPQNPLTNVNLDFVPKLPIWWSKIAVFARLFAF